MRSVRALLLLALAVALAPAGSALAKDPSWPAEITFALLSTESAPEITRRWGPILAQLEKDLGIRVKSTTATDYRGTIEALKFKKAEVGWLGPKAYIEASTNNYANVEPVAQVRNQNGSLGYRSCLIAHPDSDIFSPEDLAGKTFAFNDPNSTSGYLVPMTFFLNELGVDVKKHFSKVTFSGSHEASILAVANKKVDVASTNLPDMQQLTREGKVTARGPPRDLGVEAHPQRPGRRPQGPAAEPEDGHRGVARVHEGAGARGVRERRRVLRRRLRARPTTRSTRSCGR